MHDRALRRVSSPSALKFLAQQDSSQQNQRIAEKGLENTEEAAIGAVEVDGEVATNSEAEVAGAVDDEDQVCFEGRSIERQFEDHVYGLERQRNSTEIGNELAISRQLRAADQRGDL